MSSSPITTTRGEQTRQAILDAAEILFRSQGYNGTSMRQIAQQAGNIAVGGIYNHFASKQEIFKALLEARSPYDHLIETLGTVEGRTGPELLADAFIKLQGIMQRNLDFIILVIIDLQELEGQTIRSLAGRVIPHVMQFSLRVIQAGGLRPDLNPFVVLRAFISLMMGFTITQMVAYKDSQPLMPGLPEFAPESARLAMVDVLLYGLAARKDE